MFHSKLNGVAICLLSGGLDSTTALYVAIHEGFLPLALTIDYGQLHRHLSKVASRPLDCQYSNNGCYPAWSVAAPDQKKSVKDPMPFLNRILTRIDEECLSGTL